MEGGAADGGRGSSVSLKKSDQRGGDMGRLVVVGGGSKPGV